METQRGRGRGNRGRGGSNRGAANTNTNRNQTSTSSNNSSGAQASTGGNRGPPTATIHWTRRAQYTGDGVRGALLLFSSQLPVGQLYHTPTRFKQVRRRRTCSERWKSCGKEYFINWITVMLEMNQDDTNKLYTDFTFIHKFEKDDFYPPDKYSGIVGNLRV